MHTYTDTEINTKCAYLYRYRKKCRKREEKYFKLCTPIRARIFSKIMCIYSSPGRQAVSGRGSEIMYYIW